MPAKKWCFVPECKNTSFTTPDKIFVSVPKNKRKNWFSAARRSMLDVSTKTVFFCCEDHFNLEQDMENYLEHKWSKVKARMKPDVIPYIFACQTGKQLSHKTNACPTTGKFQRKEMAVLLQDNPDKAEKIMEQMQTHIKEWTANRNSINKDVACQTEILFQNKAIQCPTNISHFRSKAIQVNMALAKKRAATYISQEIQNV